MRGWMMTVATLFIGIAFQLVVQPPPGLSCFPPEMLASRLLRCRWHVAITSFRTRLLW
jgi:hypothetical protein